jgi:hypothetical protein
MKISVGWAVAANDDFYLFICNCDDSVDNLEYVTANDLMKWVMNWKSCGRKRPGPDLRSSSRHLPGGTEEIHQTIQDSLCLGWNLNQVPARCSVAACGNDDDTDDTDDWYCFYSALMRHLASLHQE